MSRVNGSIKCKFHVGSVHIVVWDNPNPKKPGEFIPNITFKRYYHNKKTNKYGLADGFRESDLPSIITAVEKYLSCDYRNENSEEHRT